MLTNPTISIVVPVYNAEKTLERCIDSILRQSCSDFEVLLIDDGSSDYSWHICEQYSKQDGRIKVFHKKNGGISSVRQLGLDKCCGKYIQFIDSDDWIEETCLEENLFIAENTNADIVISDFFINSNACEKRKQQKYSGDLIEDFFSGRIFGALWNKLIRLKLIKESRVSFCHELSFCEDLTFLCELAINSKEIKVQTNPTAYYHYCVNANSLTKKTTKRKLENEERYIEVMNHILQSHTDVNFQSNYQSIAWGYLKLGILSFGEYKQKLSNVSFNLKMMSFSKWAILLVSRNYIGYVIITNLLQFFRR